MSSNAGQMDMLVSGIVVALLVAMFIGGAFMIVEANGDNTVKTPDGKASVVVEPKKMFFGIAYLIAAVIFAIIFVIALYRGRRNFGRPGNSANAGNNYSNSG
jgi:TRAP-type C4-dicarboxylate transport system permease small subunit